MALVTAIQDRLDLSVADCKELLGIPLSNTSQDILIACTIEAGKQSADAFCNNPFWQRVDLPFDDLVNWRGNLSGASEDILINSDVGTTQRLPHTLPERYVQPTVDLAIPEMIRLGIVRMVQFQLTVRAPNIASERIGDWQQQYSSFVSEPDRMKHIQATYWRQWRLIPGF